MDAEQNEELRQPKSLEALKRHKSLRMILVLSEIMTAVPDLDRGLEQIHPMYDDCSSQAALVDQHTSTAKLHLF